MSTVENEVFPDVPNDPFAGFSTNIVDGDTGDPFASPNNDFSSTKSFENDPFATFSVCKAKTADSGNPFLSDEGKQSSGDATPFEEQASFQNPWPGNNTVDSSEETSHDSAASSTDVRAAEQFSCSKIDSSGTSSEKEIPNIALDSDSGNLTADVNESAPLSNAVYGFIETDKPNLQIPKVIFTEATIESEKSSSFDALNVNSAADEGQTRLLESTDSSEAMSHSNIISMSVNESNDFVQIENLSTMNISMIEGTSDDDNKTNSARSNQPTEAHNFFLESGSVQDAATVEISHSGENNSIDPEALSAKPNRVFTSSPICMRTPSPDLKQEPEVTLEPLKIWKKEFQERIASQVEQEKEDIKELRETAKCELEEWYKDRQARIEIRHSSLVKNEFIEEEKSDDENTWKKMASLALDLQRSQKAEEKRKDTTRMKNLLQLLAKKAPIRVDCN